MMLNIQNLNRYFSLIEEEKQVSLNLKLFFDSMDAAESKKVNSPFARRAAEEAADHYDLLTEYHMSRADKLRNELGFVSVI